MTTNQEGGDWLRLPDAIGATGLSEKTIQRYAKAGKIERDDRGYGQVFYLIPAEIRKDRQAEGAVVSLLREQGEKQVQTIDKAATALEVTTMALAKELQTTRLEANQARRVASRYALAAALLLATSVGISVIAWEGSKALENEKATRRQLADIASGIDSELDKERAFSTLLLADLERERMATRATISERDALAVVVETLASANEPECLEADKSATSPTVADQKSGSEIQVGDFADYDSGMNNPSHSVQEAEPMVETLALKSPRYYFGLGGYGGRSVRI